MTAPMRSLPKNLPAPTTAAAVIARFLAVVASQIGYREGKSGSDYNNDNAFGVWYGTNGVSWCAQFVSWAAFAAGIPVTVIPKHQYTPTGWNWFSSRNLDETTPRAGDLVYVYGPVPSEGISRVHHVGIVEKVLAGGKIQTIEANTNTSGSSQGNGVYRLVRTITPKLRFARPPYQLAIVKPPADSNNPTPPEEIEVTKDEMDDIVQGYALWARANELATDLAIAKERGDTAAIKVLTPRSAQMTADWKAHSATVAAKAKKS